MTINFEHYRVFYYVALYNSISRAAEELFVSQPAVSKTIRNLEDSLKCTLFVRTSQGTRLTPEGKILFEHVSKAYEEFQIAEQLVSRNTAINKGDIYIGATESALNAVLLKKLPEFISEFPDIRVHISGYSTPALIDDLKDGLIDLALGVTPISSSIAVPTIELCEIEDKIFAHKDFPIPSLNHISIQDLLRFPLVGVSRESSAGKHIEAFFIKSGFKYKPMFTVETSSQVMQFVEKKLAIGIAPSWTLETSPSGNITVLNTTFSIPPRKVFLAINEKFPLSPLCRQFIKILSR